MKKGEMTSGIDLAAGLEESLGRLGGRFKVELVDQDWLGRHNLVVVAADVGVECIDERPLEIAATPRTGIKFPGASLGKAALTALNNRQPLTAVLGRQLREGKPVHLHDDNHHHEKWKELFQDATGCGFHDRLREILNRFLELDDSVLEWDRPTLVGLVTDHEASAIRTRKLIQKGADISATYAGFHTGRRLVVNTLEGKTLHHLAPDGERNFVVDAWSAGNPEKMAKLALATVDILFPPELQIEVAILKLKP